MLIMPCKFRLLFTCRDVHFRISAYSRIILDLFLNSRIFPEYGILLQKIVFRPFRSIRQCIVVIDVDINSGINALLWSLVKRHFMLFLYDKEDTLAYCCHKEEPMNFQSLFFPIKTNEKRNARVFKKISNLALSCTARVFAYSVQLYTTAITCSCRLFAVCACYRVSNA